MVQICSEITRGRVLNGELYAQKTTEVNLSEFVYRLFHGMNFASGLQSYIIV